MVPVDPKDHGYFPYFVKLHRCAGSANTVSPKVQHCVVKSYDELSIQVYSRSSNFRRTTVTMKNHTSCAHECVASPDDCDLTVQDWNDDLCACKCRYPDGPPKELACKDGFRYVCDLFNHLRTSFVFLKKPISKSSGSTRTQQNVVVRARTK